MHELATVIQENKPKETLLSLDRCIGTEISNNRKKNINNNQQLNSSTRKEKQQRITFNRKQTYPQLTSIECKL